MFSKWLNLLLFIVFIGSVRAQSLSSQAQVSLVVVAPGQDIYSYFGHCAIWIYDPANQIDRTYEYTTADVSDFQFYAQTFVGTLDYQLWIRSMPYLKEVAKQERRGVTILELNLSPAQKQRLYQYFIINWQPQHRKFRYRFFEQNCATKLRDILENVLQIKLNDSWHTQPKTYRNWMNEYLPPNSWSRFALNFSLGFPIDKLTTAREALFLPENLMRAVKSTHIAPKKPLVIKIRYIDYK